MIISCYSYMFKLGLSLESLFVLRAGDFGGGSKELAGFVVRLAGQDPGVRPLVKRGCI
jgi:hypothetical protein